MRVLLLGGSGQLGARLARRLGAEGCRVIATSRSGRAGTRPFDPFGGDWRGLGRFDALVNAIGAIEERGADTWERVHEGLVERIVAHHGALGEPRVVSISALGARPDHRSRFLSTKARGDGRLLRALRRRAVIVRPSIVCTPGTRLVVRLRRLAQLSRITGGWLPVPRSLLRGRVQPVAMVDLEELVLALVRGEPDQHSVIAIGGEERYGLIELSSRALEARGVRLRPVPVPDGVVAAGLALPGTGRLLAREELRLMGEDNTLGGAAGSGDRLVVGRSTREFFLSELRPHRRGPRPPSDPPP